MDIPLGQATMGDTVREAIQWIFIITACIAGGLTSIFKSLITEQAPYIWRTLNVMPLFKKAGGGKSGNYRSVR